MTKNEKISEVAKRPLDRRLISKLEKAGTVLDYISGIVVNDMLNEAFGNTWSVEFSKPEVKTYSIIKGRNGKPDYQPQEIVEVKCTLTVPMKDKETGEVVNVKREAFGTAAMKNKFEEMVLKSAQTDSFKKAAYYFGIAGELFRSEAEQDYFLENNLGVWTRNAMQKYANEWSYIRKYMTEHNFGKDFNKCAEVAYDSAGYLLTPQNIKEVIRKLSEKEKAA